MAKPQMTFKEMREQNRITETSHMGPGTYLGNPLTDFVKKNTGAICKFTPKKQPAWERPNENSPSPDKYDTKKGHDFLQSKIKDITSF